MKKNLPPLTVLLAMLLTPFLLLADGVVLYHKATGNIFSNYIPAICQDGSTNYYPAFEALQPKETTFDGDTVLGRQVYYPVNWTNFDLASYKTASKSPKTTNDLTGVAQFNVLKQQSTSVVVSNKAVAEITAAIQSLKDAINRRMPATNQITDVELFAGTTNKITADPKSEAVK